MNKKEQAMHMYLNESCSQQHIADTIGVSVRTIYSWIRQNSWDRLKQASLAAPVIIADNMCFQLLAMQQAIAAREPGQQFPTMQEAEMSRKLVMCIDKLKRYPSLTQSMQVLETFRQYVKAGNERDSWPIERWMGKFMASKAKGGFRPNDIEYNAEKLSPFGMPIEEEDTDDIPTTTPVESEAEIFSDQPETLLKTETHNIENQLTIVSESPARSQPNRQLSEANQQILAPGNVSDADGCTPELDNSSPHPPIHHSGIEEQVDKLTAENFKDENVSPETVAAYRQSLMLVMEGNLLHYDEENLQSENLPDNTMFMSDNQLTTPTSGIVQSRQ